MTFPDTPDGLTALIRELMSGVRRHVADHPLEDPVDQVLAAVTVAAAALALAWPRARKAPRFVLGALAVGQRVLARAAWWTPS